MYFGRKLVTRTTYLFFDLLTDKNNKTFSYCGERCHIFDNLSFDRASPVLKVNRNVFSKLKVYNSDSYQDKCQFYSNIF